MDAHDRKRKRERREARDRAEKRASERSAQKPISKKVGRQSPYNKPGRYEKPYAKAGLAGVAPYRINAPAARKMGIDEGLRSALDDFSSKTRARLREVVAAPLTHIEPAALRRLEIKPPKTAVRPKDRSKLAKEFAKEPERVKSDTPRDNTCKSRPKSNRSKVGGGGKKRFIPWC